MYKLLGGLKDYFKRQDIYTDSVVFRLHNSFTTALLLCCSLVITATQFVGQPINCIANGIPTHVVNTYCWISSTYTMPDAFKRQVGHEVAHPGIANDFSDEDAKKYYTYYQWVCFVLFFQAAVCYLPKFLWEGTEGDLMRTLVMGLNVSVYKEDEKLAKKQAMINYVLKRLRQHKLYVLRYFACEMLCLVNILGQIWMLNRFFDDEFFTYGWRVMETSDTPQDQRFDPMVYVFPRVTKCSFHKFGASGSIQRHDLLCILPLNIVNEKTYVFIWYWFILLVILLIGLLVHRLIIIIMPSFRVRLLKSINHMIPRDTAQIIVQKTDLGDWWVLYMLGGNLDPHIFRYVVAELATQIEPPITIEKLK